MSSRRMEFRPFWIGLGLVAGLALAFCWPAERAQAIGTDRNERFAITSVTTGFQQPDAIFVLDFLTGRLVGGLLNQQSAVFTNYYFRNVGADFGIDPTAKPQFVLMSGEGALNNRGPAQLATGLIYIGELTSGKVVAYRFPYRISPTPVGVITLEPFAFFSFRDVEPK